MKSEYFVLGMTLVMVIVLTVFEIMHRKDAKKPKNISETEADKIRYMTDLMWTIDEIPPDIKMDVHSTGYRISFHL